MEIRSFTRRNRGIALLWTAAALLGVLHVWKYRHAMNPDGISYLDMGDAWLRGDWHTAINGYFSPLYAVVLGIALKTLGPAPYSEFTAVHVVNFAIYLLALGCFHFFLTGLMRRLRGSEGQGISEAVWLALGYGLFIWSSLSLITIELVNPDLLVSGVLYLAAGTVLRIEAAKPARGAYLMLGAVLGFGYLTKTVVFVIALVFLFAAGVVAGTARRAIPRVSLALIVFLAISLPWIATVSRACGHFTIGESGSMGYAFMVDQAPLIHGRGPWAVHPTRKLLDDPAVYEFAAPVGGTYPPWYDPSWWNQGLTPVFSLTREVRVVARHLARYVGFFVNETGFLIAGAVALWLLGGRQPIQNNRAILCATVLPSVAAFGLYTLVWIEWRYLGAFVVLLWLGILAIIAAGDRKLTRPVGAGMVAVIALKLVWSVYALLAMAAPGTDSARLAAALNDAGVRPGSQIAVIGNSYVAYWARLARVRIVAEIPENLWDWELRQPHPNDVDRFRQADAAKQARALRELAGTGASAVVTNQPPLPVPPGWRRLDGTDYYAFLF